MKQLIIDRIEGNYAICEDKEEKFFAIEVPELPQGAKEGTVLDIQDADGTIVINEEETNRRREKMNRKQHKLFSKSK